MAVGVSCAQGGTHDVEVAHMRNNALLALAIVLFSSGCASWYLRGARMTRGAPPGAMAAWVAPACTQSNGATIAGAQANYYLVQGPAGLELHEIEANGVGAAITNYWADQNGHNFFVWVGGSHGWHYVIPEGGQAVRYVYNAYTYRGDTSTPGVTRPVGTPSAQCPMVPQA
jgi:hypothetical protein